MGYVATSGSGVGSRRDGHLSFVSTVPCREHRAIRLSEVTPNFLCMCGLQKTNPAVFNSINDLVHRLFSVGEEQNKQETEN